MVGIVIMGILRSKHYTYSEPEKLVIITDFFFFFSLIPRAQNLIFKSSKIFERGGSGQRTSTDSLSMLSLLGRVATVVKLKHTESCKY